MDAFHQNSGGRRHRVEQRALRGAVGNNRAEWIKTLDQIAALNPAVVIPGHQVAGAKTAFQPARGR